MTTLVVRAIALLAGLLSLLAAQSVHAALPPTVRVALFDDPGFVDTSSLTPGAESDNVQAALSSFGYVVAPFTGTTEAAWRAATANADVVVVPELELGDLAAALDENAEQALVDFASGGGTVIVMGNSSRATALITAVFGFATSVAAADVSGRFDAVATGTRFAFGPDSLPVNNGSLAVTGLSGVYRTAALNSMVGRVLVGAGRLVYLGWDWYDAAPLGTQDGGWNEVLRRAVLEGRPPSRRVAVYADAAYVDVTSADPGAEARNVQATLVAQDALVANLTGTDDLSFAVLGPARRPTVDVLVVPEQNAALAAAMTAGARTMVRSFVDTGGTLVVHGGSILGLSAGFVNTIFGFATTNAYTNGAVSTRVDAGDGPFAGGPPTLPGPSNTTTLGALPTGARPYYVANGEATVVAIPYGEGWIWFVGWDWYDAAPLGTQDAGWLAVYDRIVRSSPPARRVALFANEAIVDAAESPASASFVDAEVVSLSASLAARGHAPRRFTALDRAGWSVALAGADALLVPEQENGSLALQLDAATRADLAAWVRRGGTLLVCGDSSARAAALLNSVFGFAVGSQSVGVAQAETSTSHGTPFESLPASLPAANATFGLTGLPTGASSAFASGAASTLAWIPVGAGAVAYVGWDFFNAAPAGGAQDGGWVDALDLAVQASRPRTRHVAVFTDPAYVETISPAPSPEAEGLPAALALLDHRVTEIGALDDAAFRAALGGADALLIPKQAYASLAPALSGETSSLLRRWVASGGALIAHGDGAGRTAELLNFVFGWQTAEQLASGSILGGGAAGTRFAGMEEILSGTNAVTELAFASLPPGAIPLASDDGGDGTSVIEIPYGRGRVLYLGWSYTVFPSLGLLNRAWLDVLDRAAQTARPRGREIALFADPGYVDTSPGYFSEVQILEASLALLGHSSRRFVGTSAADWSNALAKAQVAIVPDLENGDPTGALDAATRQRIRDFVARGGTLLAHNSQSGHEAGLLNTLFGLALVEGAQEPGPFTRTAAAAGTAFATGPAQLQALNATLTVQGLPAHALSFYEDASGGSVVSRIPYGAGQIVLLGWDFYQYAPFRISDDGSAAWRDVLRRALDLAPPAARQVAVLDDPGVVDTNGAASAESDNVQAALLQREHAVVPFTGTSLAAFDGALARADVLLVPEQEIATLAPLLDAATRNALRAFVDGGGGLIAQGNGAAELVNALYGTAIALDPITDGQSHLQAGTDLGTSFAGGPTPLGALAGGKGWQGAPADARVVYRTNDPGNPFTVLWLPRGSGRVVLTGFPWYDVVPFGGQNDGGWNEVLDRAVREGMGGDPDHDGVSALRELCPLVADPLQLDSDADGVGDACDNCVAVANPRVVTSDVAFLAVNAWATLSGGQRDDDHDGHGNRCDAKFPFTAGAIVGAPDLAQLRASLGQSRVGDTCGTAGSLPCAIFDVDEVVTTISAGDVLRFRALLGKAPGPRCTTCPLPCSAGANGSCEALPHP